MLIRQSSDENPNGDLVSDVGNEIKVTLDQWTVGQLGVADLIAAAAVIAGGFVLAWLASRLVRRVGRHTDGAAGTAIATIGQLVGGSVMLLSMTLALEILGFSLGPVLMLILIAIVAMLLMRPLITNLSSGLLLQVRGALDVGDLVMTRGEFGVVKEITTRTVVIDTADGRRIHAPNSDVLDDTIVNYTSLGSRRSSFEVTVAFDEDVELVLTTIRSALSGVPELDPERPSEAQLARVSGRLVAVRVLVWHGPDMADERAAVDAALRVVLADLREAGVELDGPTVLELGSDLPRTS